MSPKNRYKVKNLVSNRLDIAKFQDKLLVGPTGILIDEKTLWVANNGRLEDSHVMTHYKLNGQPLPEQVFFPNGIEPTVQPIQEQLLYNLLYLYKTFLAQTSGLIFQVPIPNSNVNQPVIDEPTEQALILFLSGPNGYLTNNANVTQLIGFCVDTPNLVPPVPIDSQLQKAFSTSIQSCINTSFDIFNQSLINQLTLDLLNNQELLPPLSNSRDQYSSMIKEHSEILPMRTRDIITSHIFPIGLVFNDSGNFVISRQDQGSAASKILAATSEGLILGYNPLVDPDRMIIAIDNDTAKSIYVGLTIVGNNLYAADFYNRRIDVFNFDFKLLHGFEFVDPSLPSDFVPFNIVNINDLLYVLYAKINLSTLNNYIVGPGNGFVNIFKPDGTFVRRFISQGQLNTPWGLVIAPEHFGPFAGKFLIANQGDGKINVYNKDGKHIAKLKDKRGHTLVINGLWGLVSHIKSVYFSSDQGRLTDGLIGKIKHD